MGTFDNFQPFTVIQKLDSMRQEFTDSSASYVHDEFAKGVAFALIWARVEVFRMAFDKLRYVAD